MSTQNKKHAEIDLPYYKKGDDLYGCIEKNENDKIDAKKTLLNHIKLLNRSIDILQKIYDAIPADNDIELSGDTHFIGISGDKDIIDKLIKDDLVTELTYPEGSGCSCSCCSSSSDESMSDSDSE